MKATTIQMVTAIVMGTTNTEKLIWLALVLIFLAKEEKDTWVMSYTTPHGTRNGWPKKILLFSKFCFQATSSTLKHGTYLMGT